MTEFELLVDLFKDNLRQGPGSSKETKRALDLSGFDKNKKLKIADIGCGCGAQTFTLAQNTRAHITAVDLSPVFLEEINKKSKSSGFDERITTLNESMEQLSFEENSFDLIWSEGAVYMMGFENAVRELKKFLKRGGILAVSEITWFSANRPAELEGYWSENYPGIASAAEKIRQLEMNDYTPLAYFKLPEYCWTDEYYNPLEKLFEGFLARHNFSEQAKVIVENEKKEMELFNQFKEYYGYGFYIARNFID